MDTVRHVCHPSSATVGTFSLPFSGPETLLLAHCLSLPLCFHCLAQHLNSPAKRPPPRVPDDRAPAVAICRDQMCPKTVWNCSCRPLYCLVCLSGCVTWIPCMLCYLITTHRPLPPTLCALQSAILVCFQHHIHHVFILLFNYSRDNKFIFPRRSRHLPADCAAPSSSRRTSDASAHGSAHGSARGRRGGYTGSNGCGSNKKGACNSDIQ